MKLCIDLFSGLERISQAFKRSPDWEVVSIDVDPKFKPTIIADARFLPLKQNLQPDVFLAGPPCPRFSIACHTWPKMGIKLAMELIGATLEAVAWLKPKCWLIENPMGRLRWFLGTPQQTIRLADFGTSYQKKTDLWGNIILPMIPASRPHTTYLRPGSKSTTSPLAWMKGHNASQRAKMPEGLSMAVLEAVS